MRPQVVTATNDAACSPAHVLSANVVSRLYMFVGGRYVIVTSSKSSGGRAILISLPVSAALGDQRCLELWWSSSTASLTVQVLRHDGILVSLPWNQSSTIVRSPSGEQWQQATINLSVEGPFQVCSLLLVSTAYHELLLVQFVREVCRQRLWPLHSFFYNYHMQSNFRHSGTRVSGAVDGHSTASDIAGLFFTKI